MRRSSFQKPTCEPTFKSSRSIRMFMLIILLTLWRLSDTEADLGSPKCSGDFCVALNKDVITAETGRSAVIHCSFNIPSDFNLSSLAWYRCAPGCSCGDSDQIFDSRNQNKIQPGCSGRVSLLEPDLSQRNCSIIITDLRLSDSGRYVLTLNSISAFSFIFGIDTVSVKVLQQKPTVQTPALTEWMNAPVTVSLLSALSVSLILIVVFIVVIVILVLRLRTMKPNHEDRVVSLQKREASSEYEVMTRIANV